jgi:hypothetical protein
MDGYDIYGNYWCLPSCTFIPCKGQPCQQTLDYHSQLWNLYQQFQNDFISFDTNIIAEPRSDIMKELTYSRQTTNSCSLTNTVYGSTGINSGTRLLSCTRAEDELTPPINNDKINFAGKPWTGYCYGQKLGALNNTSLTDNWFCCQEWADNSTINENPIYNINKNNY